MGERRLACFDRRPRGCRHLTRSIESAARARTDAMRRVVRAIAVSALAVALVAGTVASAGETRTASGFIVNVPHGWDRVPAIIVDLHDLFGGDFQLDGQYSPGGDAGIVVLAVGFLPRGATPTSVDRPHGDGLRIQTVRPASPHTRASGAAIRPNGKELRFEALYAPHRGGTAIVAFIAGGGWWGSSGEIESAIERTFASVRVGADADAPRSTGGVLATHVDGESARPLALAAIGLVVLSLLATGFG